MFHFLHACTCNSYIDKKNMEKISQINYTVYYVIMNSAPKI